MGGLARDLLLGVASAREKLADAQAIELEALALKLAGAVLGSHEVALAARITDGDRLMLTHAVELARVIVRADQAGGTEVPSAPQPQARVLHRGQAARRIGDR